MALFKRILLRRWQIAPYRPIP